MLRLHLCVLLSSGCPHLSHHKGGKGLIMRAQDPFFLPASFHCPAPHHFGSEASAEDGLHTLKFPGLPLSSGVTSGALCFCGGAWQRRGATPYSQCPAAPGLAGRLRASQSWEQWPETWRPLQAKAGVAASVRQRQVAAGAPSLPRAQPLPVRETVTSIS